jgi:hypothetical protein
VLRTFISLKNSMSSAGVEPVVFYDSQLTAIISLNSINQVIFVMVKCGVLFEVRTEISNIV